MFVRITGGCLSESHIGRFRFYAGLLSIQLANGKKQKQEINGDKTYVEDPGCGDPWAAFSSGAVVAHPTLEYQNIKGDKTYVEDPGCGDPWAAFSSGAVVAHPTLEYPQKYNKRWQDMWRTLVVETPGQPSVVELWWPTLP